MIHFGCPTCGKSFQVKDKYAGKRTKCPKCGQAIQLLKPSSPAHSAAEGQSSVIRPFYRPPQRHTSQAGLFIGCAAVFLLVFGIILVAIWNSGVTMTNSDRQVHSKGPSANIPDHKASDQQVHSKGPSANIPDHKASDQPPATPPQFTAFNPMDLEETSRWFGDRYEAFVKGYFITDGLLRKEATEQVQRELRQLVGRKIRWTVNIFDFYPTYATLCGIGEIKGGGVYYLSMWTFARLPTKEDYLVPNHMNRPRITLADIGRDKFDTLGRDTEVIVEGTIRGVRIVYNEKIDGGRTRLIDGIDLVICGCKASLLER
jgi:DNA-directed RNA polymerase subunit RPC12/RpoP